MLAHFGSPSNESLPTETLLWDCYTRPCTLSQRPIIRTISWFEFFYNIALPLSSIGPSSCLKEDPYSITVLWKNPSLLKYLPGRNFQLSAVLGTHQIIQNPSMQKSFSKSVCNAHGCEAFVKPIALFPFSLKVVALGLQNGYHNLLNIGVPRRSRAICLLRSRAILYTYVHSSSVNYGAKDHGCQGKKHIGYGCKAISYYNELIQRNSFQHISDDTL